MARGNEIVPYQAIRTELTSPGMLAKLQSVLPQDMRNRETVSKYIGVALMVIAEDEKLIACTPKSIRNAIVSAATVGWWVGGALADAYMVPFGPICTLVPDYRGLIRTAVDTGVYNDIKAEVVYEADEFDYRLGTDAYLHHKPNFAADDPGVVLCAYAIGIMPNGQRTFKVVPNRDLEKLRV